MRHRMNDHNFPFNTSDAHERMWETVRATNTITSFTTREHDEPFLNECGSFFNSVRQLDIVRIGPSISI